MATDLIARLRHAHEHSQQRIVGSNIFQEATSALEAKDAEIERLRREYNLADKSDMSARDLLNDLETKLAATETRAEQAERAHLDLTSYIEGWMSPGELKLHVGEMTAQEIRAVKAVLSAILDKARAARTFQPGDRVIHVGRNEAGTVESVTAGSVKVMFDKLTSRGNRSIGVYDDLWLRTYPNGLKLIESGVSNADQ